MVRQNVRGHRTRGTKPSSSRRNFTSIATSRGDDASRSHMHYVSPNVKLRYGFKIVEWSGRKSTRWRAWISFLITCRLMATPTNSRPTPVSLLIWPHRTSSRPPSSGHTLSGFLVCTANKTSKALSPSNESSRYPRRLNFRTMWETVPVNLDEKLRKWRLKTCAKQKKT